MSISRVACDPATTHPVFRRLDARRVAARQSIAGYALAIGAKSVVLRSYLAGERQPGLFTVDALLRSEPKPRRLIDIPVSAGDADYEDLAAGAKRVLDLCDLLDDAGAHPELVRRFRQAVDDQAVVGDDETCEQVAA